MFARSTVTFALAGILGAGVLAAGCREPAAFAPRDPGATTYTSAGTIASDVAAITLDQQNSTLGESGRRFVKGFNPVNPRNGDAIVVTFFWVGSTNIITSVTDHLTSTNWPPVGNTYTLVEYVTAGGISMATYVATNVQNIPIANANQDNVLAVEALLSDSAADGGIWMSAWSGVGSVSPLGAHRSASGAGVAPTATTVGGPLANGAGSLVYGVTLSRPPVGMDPPSGFSSIDPFGAIGDAVLKADGRYSVRTAAGSIDPQWTWFYDPTSPGTWLSSGLVLNPPSLHLAFTAQPSTTLPLVTIQPPVQVAVQDEAGNTVTGFSGQVTIAIGHNGGLLVAGTLSGTKTVNVVNGVATFSDLSIDQPGNGYTLVATVAGATNAESAPFNIGVM